MEAKPIQELILAKVRDPLGNHYIFSLGDSEALKGSTEDIYREGVLVAYKKGKDPFKERGGARSAHWKVFQALYPRFVVESDILDFLAIIETKMREMGAIGVSVKEDLVVEAEEPKSDAGLDEEVPPAELSGLTTEELLSKLREMSAPGSGISGDYFKGFVHGVLSDWNK